MNKNIIKETFGKICYYLILLLKIGFFIKLMPFLSLGFKSNVMARRRPS
jgi:hypothetical protein